MSYTKQQFRQGDILRASQLNAMDDIIASHEERLTNMGSEDYLTTDSLKTINGQSLVGSGNIAISGGTGTVGPQGPQGEQGPKGDDGADGVSVTSVKQTTTSTADGGTNVVTVTLSNGTTSTFNIKNGSKGSTGSKGDTGATGANGSNGVTFTPSVDSAGNLSWTNNGGLTNPSTINIKGPKGDNGENGGGKEVDTTHGAFIEQAEPNKIYIMSSDLVSGLLITDLLFPEDATYCEYTFIFDISDVDFFGGTSITIPDYVVWANGQIPDLSLADVLKTYELSIVGWRSRYNDDISFHAVLTPFKPI